MLTESEIREAESPGADRVAGSAVEREAVISVENVSVEYVAPNERFTSFKDYAIKLIQRRVRQQHFKALSNISLEVSKGEVFGLIGHNGAGKSTLLKVISRVMKPSSGRVRVVGRVAPLLELGAGFHPELSGRENIFLNGTLLGYTHEEMESVFDKIVEFSEMEDFIDSPQRTYSSGMTVRLGFAVATAFKPDILIVDEVLAVGDEKFREKCWARMNEFREGDTTILLVTHNSEIIRSFCDRAAWIDHGELRAIGDPAQVTSLYYEAYHPSRLSAPPSGEATGSGPGSLEQKTLGRQWNYPFELPGGGKTPNAGGPERAALDEARLEMLYTVIQGQMGQRWERASCLDIGCNQGYYTFALGRSGCQKAVGIDCDPDLIAAADELKPIYDLPNVGFRVSDLMNIDEETHEKFDLVVMMGVLSSLESPVTALRKASALSRRMLIVETEVLPARPDEVRPALAPGAFGLVENDGRGDRFALVPDRNSLVWLLKQLGFYRVDLVPPPPGAGLSPEFNNRAFIAAYR